MFRQAIFNKRTRTRNGALVALRFRIPPIARKPRGNGEQCAQMIMRIRAGVERIANQLAKIARKRIRKEGGSFDNAGIAEARL